MTTSNWILIGVAAALGLFLFMKSRGDMSVEDAKQLVQEGAVLVDVRTTEEFAAGHIEGALNLPLHELQSRLSELKKEEEIVLYCRSGNRSGQAAAALRSAGYEKVHNFGAMSRW